MCALWVRGGGLQHSRVSTVHASAACFSGPAPHYTHRLFYGLLGAVVGSTGASAARPAAASRTSSTSERLKL